MNDLKGKFTSAWIVKKESPKAAPTGREWMKTVTWLLCWGRRLLPMTLESFLL